MLERRIDMDINWSYLKYLLQEEHQYFVKSPVDPASSKWKKIFSLLASEIWQNLDDKLNVDSSWGIGKWAYFPWIRISYPEIGPSPTDGIFIDYLFGWEDHEVYLTLLQGVDSLPESQQKMILTETKKLIQNKIPNGSFEKTRLFYEPNIVGTSAKKKRAQSYAAGMIFYKKYSINSFPDDYQLNSDLQEMIDIYKKILNLK